MAKTVFIVLSFLIFQPEFIYSQEDLGASERNLLDPLRPFSYSEISSEYFVIDPKNSLLDTRLILGPAIDQRNIVEIEIPIVVSWIESGNYVLPGDVVLSYRRNFFSSKYKLTGWQGVVSKLTFTLPTGSDEFFSGFDSWTIEPDVLTGWLLGETNWFLNARARYNYSFAALPGKEPRFSYSRLDVGTGYENQSIWIEVAPDWRFIPSRSSHNLFLKAELGLKFSEILGMYFRYKPRLSGDEFFDTLTSGHFYILF